MTTKRTETREEKPLYQQFNEFFAENPESIKPYKDEFKRILKERCEEPQGPKTISEPKPEEEKPSSPSPSKPLKPSPTLSPEKVKEMIKVASPIEFEIVWIPRIMENQTEDERASMTTTESNGKGLNAFDAKTITAYFKKIKSGRHLTPKQVEITRKKLMKYSSQYSAMTA